LDSFKKNELDLFRLSPRQPGILASAQEPKPQSGFKMMEYNWQPDKQASKTNVK